MYAQKEKSREKQSKVLVNSVSQKENNVKQSFGFIDSRPKSYTERINHSKSTDAAIYGCVPCSEAIQKKSNEKYSTRERAIEQLQQRQSMSVATSVVQLMGSASKKITMLTGVTTATMILSKGDGKNKKVVKKVTEESGGNYSPPQWIWNRIGNSEEGRRRKADAEVKALDSLTEYMDENWREGESWHLSVVTSILPCKYCKAHIKEWCKYYKVKDVSFET